MAILRGLVRNDFRGPTYLAAPLVLSGTVTKLVQKKADSYYLSANYRNLDKPDGTSRQIIGNDSSGPVERRFRHAFP
jgi:hypothetical protein